MNGLRGSGVLFAGLGVLGVVGIGVIGVIVIRQPDPPGQRERAEPTYAGLGPVVSDVYGVLMEEVYELLVGVGASSAEARCLSKPFAQGANDIIEAFKDVPRTADVVHARATGCASRKRVQEILEGVDRDNARKLLETSESHRTQVADVYRSLGATEEEIACIVAIQHGPPGSLGATRWLDFIAVHEEPEYRERLAATLDAQQEELLRCATEDRLRGLGAVPPDIDERELERRQQELLAQLDASGPVSAPGPR